MATTVGVSDLTAFSTAEKVSPAPQQPKLIGHARRPEYMFVHTVRFWSMLAIVFMHGVYAVMEFGKLPTAVYALLIQGFKFGTIGFFLISGFLLGDRLPASKPAAYLQRRAARLVPAWIFWFVMQVAFIELTRFAHHWVPAAPRMHTLAVTILNDAGWCFTGTALWFVPNFMVALTCVVLLRRWVNDLRLGAVLLAANLFYTVNVYTRWLPSKHSEAVFGFVFYLWLGAWCALRKDKLERWAAALPSRLLIACAVLAAAAALLESRALFLHYSDDLMNTLRLGNQVYSVVVVIILLRFKRVTWPKFVNVGAHTYGIYLTHTMALSTISVLAVHVIFAKGQHLGPAVLVIMWMLLAPAAYLLALLLTNLLGTPWPWVMGAAAPGQKSREAAVPIAPALGQSAPVTQ